MAETLGSLVDKLTIKEIRGYHIQEMIENRDGKFSAQELASKLDLLGRQKKDLIDEINTYVTKALAQEDMVLRDEKIKLYNARDVMDSIGAVAGMGEAVSGLTQKILNYGILKMRPAEQTSTWNISARSSARSIRSINSAMILLIKSMNCSPRPFNPERRVPDMDSFLIINPYGIGDVLFSTPVISSLKAHIPHSAIYYLCNRRTAELLKDHPDINGIFIYDRDDFARVKAVSFWQWVKKWMTLIRQIREKKIQAALDFSINTGIGAIPMLAGIPRRAGLDFKHRGKFLTDSVIMNGFEGKHVAEYYLDVLALLKIPRAESGLSIGINAQAKEWAQVFFRDHHIADGDQVIGIAPCGGEAFGPQACIKRWPEEHFIELINALMDNPAVKIFLCAGPAEQDEIDRIMSGLKHPERCFSFTKITLVQCVPLVDRCDLFIGNDTGLLRFADALKKKIVAFFGPVDETVYGLFPYDPARHRYLSFHTPCRPCYRRFRLPICEMDRACLKNISVESVLKAVEELSR